MPKFLKNKLLMSLLCLLLCPFMGKAEMIEQQKIITVAVLAPTGQTETLESWQGLKQLLENTLQNYQIELLPVTIEQFQKIAINNEADLLLGNQNAFLSVFSETQLRWLASLEYNHRSFNPHSLIGSSIIVRNDSSIKHFKDLKDKKVAAVSQDALGGFLLGYKKLYDEGLEAPKDYFISFTGYPIERGFFYLSNHSVDAAIVPACLYEHLVEKKQIEAKDYRVLEPISNSQHCLSSTPLSHYWLLAALPKLSEENAEKIQHALLSNDQADLTMWRLPIGLGEVHAIKQFAGLIKVEETLFETFWRLAHQYKSGLIILIIIMMILAINHIWLTWLVRKRKRALEASYHRLHEYENILSRTDRANILGEIASGIGHELNQPLMVIRNYAEGTLVGLNKGKSPENFTKPLNNIVQQVEQCSAIIKNLQAWTKPKNIDQFEWCHFYTFMLRMIELIRVQTKNRVTIELRVSVEQQIFTVISILEQVMMNSLLNAIQAGADHIVITAEDHQDFYKILMIDNGCGFSQSQIDAPFVPFRTTKPEGLGLGLVICERLIASLGGKFRISNRKDHQQGATIRVILPKRMSE